ncbi:MAG: CPBP family intramembrane glutamic endopeptidase [Rhodothermales bacterium]|nr:CPBP family intramembrane glutamic endopeptidase [Rhodothermales bacterium]
MRERLQREWDWLRAQFRKVDRQTAFVLVAAPALVLLQVQVGSRRFFRAELADAFAPEQVPLLSWAWWFGVQGVTGFVLPVLALLLLFRRRPAEIGLGLGDWRLAGLIAGLYLPLVAVGTWVLSADPAFQADYPHLHSAARDWGVFLIYEALFILYWVGWEYLWRGFVLFGTARTFGFAAVFIQAVPFAILHADKPPAEAYLSILGGIALGALCWRVRSFWIAVPIHAAQMVILDFFCTLRIRTGVEGVGPGAFLQTLAAWLGG